MKKKFQGGGVVDETELFDDGVAIEGADTGAEGNLGGEYVDDPTAGTEGTTNTEGPEGPSGQPGPVGIQLDAADLEGLSPGPIGQPGTDGDSELSGIDLFLGSYGVRGGIIKFDDGNSAHFNELTAEGQREVLSSLVNSSVPTIEDKFDLNDSEITFLNALRESGAANVEDFVNDIVDHRMDTIVSERNASTLDFGKIADDDIYLMHLRETKPDFTDGDLVDELEKAKQLSTYTELTDGMRENYITRQEELVDNLKEQRDGAYMTQIEGQRQDIATVVDNMDNIAGSPLTDDVKEFLLHDLMELNEHNDPILMEKIFADPEQAFKANWFLTYGEDYIKNLNEYWKKEVSVAAKKGYQQSINGMPENPTIIGADRGGYTQNTTQPDGGPISFGKELDETELFD